MDNQLRYLADRRAGESIEFGRLADRMDAYLGQHPEQAEEVEGLAGFLAFVETGEQERLDRALMETFPASDPVSIED